MSKVSLPKEYGKNDFCPQTLFLYGTYKENGTPDFGLFCWFSYYWDQTLGVMACIGGNKLTLDRIHAEGIFSANLVTEAMLPMADYLGSIPGYEADKMNFELEVEKGGVLNVPVLACSPWVFELELVESLPKQEGEVLLCRIRNVLADPELLKEERSAEDKLREIAPVNNTCQQYFSWEGRRLGAWGEPKAEFEKKIRGRFA